MLHDYCLSIILNETVHVLSAGRYLPQRSWPDCRDSIRSHLTDRFLLARDTLTVNVFLGWLTAENERVYPFA